MDDVASSSRKQEALAVERARLVAWQQAGDRKALDEVLRSCMPRLQAMARRISPEGADDLAAEGIVALIHAAGRYRPVNDLPFVAYGQKIARHAMISARSKERSLVTSSSRRTRDIISGRRQDPQADLIVAAQDHLPLDMAQNALLVPASDEIALQAEKRRRQRCVMARALRRLERLERRLVVNHRLQERSDLSSLAQRLGLSPHHARQLEDRALKKMRTMLLRDGYGLEELE